MALAILNVYLTHTLRLMILNSQLKKSRYLIAVLGGAIALNMFAPQATAKLFDGPVDKLPVLERAALRQGKVVLTGDKGKYTCRILVNGSMDTAWQVLTDYDNFENFLPSVSESNILEQKGDRKVFEQTSKIRTLVFTSKSKVKIAVTESYPKTIAFKSVEGDLDSLDGTWILEPVSPYPSAPPNQVLITHQVEVAPASTPSRSLFFNIYEKTLEATLAAIKQEVEIRSIQ